MKKRCMRMALAACLMLSMLSVTAQAGEAHDHGEWKAVAMVEESNAISIDGEPQENSTLITGNYYLTGSLDVPLTISGEVELCLNGHSILASRVHAITVNAGSRLTLHACGAAGKVASTGASKYGIYNTGTVVVCGGAVESVYRGVYNGSNASCTLTGGSVHGSTYGIYNASGASRVYLAGNASVTGGEAGIYTNGNMSSIYASDGAAENPTAYQGGEISLAYASVIDGHAAVQHVTEENCASFVLSDAEGYALRYETNLKTLKFEALPLTINWYGEGEDALTGEQYPISVPYGTELTMPEPAMEGKIFFGWLYKSGDASAWSSAYWPGGSIKADMAFKADYLDGFAGSGTQDDPYQIASADDLLKLSTVVNRGLRAYNNGDVYYQMTADIDLSAVCGEDAGNWTPIGSGSNSFKASFDGGGKTISNLFINTTGDCQGLFGYLYGATIKDLTITGSVIAGSNAGALAGYVSGGSTVEHVDVSGVVTAPYGYTADSTSTMAYQQRGTTIDVKGNYKDNWISTTFADYGYEIETSQLEGATVTASADFISGGKYVQLSYTVTAGSSEITDGKLAVFADTQIGANDTATIEVIQDPSTGEAVGLKMVDDNSGSSAYNAQFNLYFDGTGGVTPADTYWFGAHPKNKDNCFHQLNADTAVADSGAYSEDYASYFGDDSAVAFSWQNISLSAGESRTYSFILGVGEKADAPQWGDGASPVCLTLAAGIGAEENRLLIDVSAKVTDAAGQTDVLYYSVNGGAGVELGRVQADGTERTIAGQIDLRGYEDGTYEFGFWMVNTAGAASPSVVKTIIISDGEITEGLDAVVPPVPTMYTVAFDAQGGSAVASITVESGSAIAELPTTTREGHTFDGWFTGSDGSGDRLTTETAITENITYYAKWTEVPSTPKPGEPGGAPVIRPVVRPGKAPEDTGCPSLAFRDLDVTQWYHKATDFVILHDLMSGSGDRFYPDGSLTRDELAQILYNAAGAPAVSGQNAFTDVKESAWYSDAVVWGSSSGIVTGFPDDTFRPDEPVTREQLAVMLYRYAKYKGHDTTLGGMAIREFPDAGSISSYAVDAMRWAVNTGIVGGFADHTLRPQSSATRAQAAQMMMRFLKS